MNKFILVSLFFVCFIVAAQEKVNPFSEAERPAQYENSDQINPASGPGNPDGEDDLPVDDYIPVLVLVAIGLIIYQTSKKQSLKKSTNN